MPNLLFLPLGPDEPVKEDPARAFMLDHFSIRFDAKKTDTWTPLTPPSKLQSGALVVCGQEVTIAGTVFVVRRLRSAGYLSRASDNHTEPQRFYFVAPILSNDLLKRRQMVSGRLHDRILINRD